MTRQDLLALTEEDLILLSNKGTVKRCVRELDENEFSLELKEDIHGNVIFSWSDNATCTLEAKAVLGANQCSCPATTICRHVVRSVLAYQRKAKEASPGSIVETPQDPVLQQHAQDYLAPTAAQANTLSDEELTVQNDEQAENDAGEVPMTPLTIPPLKTTGMNFRAGQPWNPGDITDEILNQQVKPGTIKRARKLFQAGQVLEVAVSVKPIARFFTIPCSVRFLVPGDCRYTYCNCAEESPCVHVPLAIFSFRLLQGRSAGIVSTTDNKITRAPELLHDLNKLLCEFAAVGLAGFASAFTSKFQKIRQRCNEQGLQWTSELLEALLDERERYHKGDALFSPENLVDTVGEICARTDALLSGQNSIPAIFITGSSTDRPTEQSAIRLTGVGCGVELRKHSSVITAYFHDDDSGYFTAVRRQFRAPDFDGSDTRSFSQLAESAAIKSHGLRELATGHIICKGGKLTTSRAFVIGRGTPVAWSPQKFLWERLRFPALVENLSELRSLLNFQPPGYLGPRHPGRNLHVCPVNRIEDARFSASHQAVMATVIDQGGEKALLYHPYTGRGKSGVDGLLNVLHDPRVTPLFVAGNFASRPSGLTLRPVSLVVQQGDQRRLIQPWVDGIIQSTTLPASPSKAPWSSDQEQEQQHPLKAFASSLEDALAEMLTEGVERASEHVVRRWKNMAEEGAQLGLLRLSRSLDCFHKILDSKRHNTNWTADDASSKLLEVCVVHIVLREILSDSTISLETRTL